MMDKFFNYENHPTNRIYAPKLSTDIYCWKCNLFMASIAATSTFFFLSAFLSNNAFWSHVPIYLFVPIFSGFLMLLKFHEPIGNMMSNSVTDSWRLRFENEFIYNDKFKMILDSLTPFMSQEERTQVIDAVVRKNFSSNEFTILYEAYVTYQKSTYNAVPEEDNQSVNFFNQKKVS